MTTENDCTQCEDGWVSAGYEYGFSGPTREVYEPCEHCDEGRANAKRAADAIDDRARDQFDALSDEEVVW